MSHALLDAILDTLKMVPLLLLIYVLLEAVEHRWETGLKTCLLKGRAFGPLLGALLGCVPQCGFSVIATALYTQRVISRGTLLAVYLSTSDEAVPVILAQPERVHVIFPLLAAKVVIGVAAGYLIDLIPFFRGGERLQAHDPECRCLEERHSCGRSHHHTVRWRALLIGPLRHTANVAAFLFLVSFGINLTIHYVGQENVANIFLPHSLWQPLVAVLVGLIPNCAASVAVTELFLRGAISFGSAIAGLSASSGLGLLLLMKEAKRREALSIIVQLAAISFTVGMLINSLASFR